MSKIALTPNASGSGTFTIASPNSDTDRTLTLPDEAGTVLTSASDLTGVTGAGVPDAIDVNASAPADSLAINASGLVGVNTTSPKTELSVDGSAVSGFNASAFGWQHYQQASSTYTATEITSELSGASSSLLFKTNGNWTNGNAVERMRINHGGAILWGSSTSTLHTCEFSNYGTAALDVRRYADPGNVMIFRDDTTVSGLISVNGSSCSYGTSSDYRLKENVVDMTGAITRVKSLAPKRFTWIADDTDTVVDGFIAHEAQAVVPEAIIGTYDEVDDNGNPVYQGIDQSKLVPLLTGALQEAIAKIETLETTVADLKTRVTALEATP